MWLFGARLTISSWKISESYVNFSSRLIGNSIQMIMLFFHKRFHGITEIYLQKKEIIGNKDQNDWMYSVLVYAEMCKETTSSFWFADTIMELCVFFMFYILLTVFYSLFQSSPFHRQYTLAHDILGKGSFSICK